MERRRNNQLCYPPRLTTAPSPGILHIPSLPLTVAFNYAQMEMAGLLKWTLVLAKCSARSLSHVFHLDKSSLSLSLFLRPVIRSGRDRSVFSVQQLEARSFRPGWSTEVVLRPPQHAPSCPTHETHFNHRYGPQ